ncbi:MAG: phosphonate metabolism transcriptional regulator PhnF [Neptuniibacter sp.]
MSALMINRGSGSLPVYKQISESLRQEVQNLYKAGDLLPPEAELAKRYSVNRHTLRRAVDELVEDGLVIRQHGKGTFVLAPTIDYVIGANTRFTENLESLGVTTQSRVLRKQIIPARGGVAEKLKIEVGTKVIFLETLREVDGKPFCISSHFLPLELAPEVYASYQSSSLHAFLDTECSVKIKRIESLISAVTPLADDALQLQMPRNMPALRVKSLNVEMDSQVPIEYVVTRFRGDTTQLSIQP